MVADAVVILHLVWIGFLIFGAMIGRSMAWVKWAHVGALTFSVLLQAFGWICPLTYLERRLRADAGGGYAGDFIAHYAERLVYLQVPRETVFAATIVIIALSAWTYWPAKKALNAQR